ncbi:MAG TPA: SDR family NAD(P)-dependent oxidoreductase [Thermoanaerobaculia bacterium]|nr:SDR family NAD(P)-dependent oxidoreductase [Thermoanaerobaculia bacterium]
MASPETSDRAELRGRTAVVTGGGRGIGAAVARRLAAAGAAVAVAARSGDEIEAVAGELRAAGARALAVPCDVTDEGSVAALRRAVEAELGPADVLVNNAGVASSAPIARLSLAEWNRMFTVNATGTFLGTREFLPGMLERGWGRVVNVASIAGVAGARYIAAYAASKHAVVGLTRCAAAEGAARGVTVNAVCPGYVDTGMTDESVARIAAKTGLDPGEARARIVAANPQGRLLQPEEVAHLVLALCDPLAAGVNGQAIVLDGGGGLVG